MIMTKLLNEKIRHVLRHEVKKTQKYVARNLGINPGTLRSALHDNRFGAEWLFKLCADLGLPDNEVELHQNYTFDLSHGPRVVIPDRVEAEVVARFEKVKKACSDVRQDIDAFYAAMNKNDLVVVITYSEMPEEWTGGFIAEAAKHVTKGAYLLYVVPSEGVLSYIRNRFAAICLQSEVSYKMAFAQFMESLKNKSDELKLDRDRFECQIALALTEVPLFLCPGHKYVLFRHNRSTWAMGYYPFGRGTDDEHQDVSYRNAFIPIAGPVVKTLRLFVLKAVRESLKYEFKDTSQHKALSTIEELLTDRPGEV